MTREEFYQARHDFRASVREIDRRYPMMSAENDRAYSALYSAYPDCVRDSGALLTFHAKPKTHKTENYHAN